MTKFDQHDDCVVTYKAGEKGQQAVAEPQSSTHRHEVCKQQQVEADEVGHCFIEQMLGVYYNVFPLRRGDRKDHHSDSAEKQDPGTHDFHILKQDDRQGVCDPP